MPVAEWIHGGDGRTLAEVWKGSPQAYLGAAVAGFPNLFMLVGPNTGLGHNSIVFMIESQLHYLIECLRFMDRERPARGRGARGGPAPLQRGDPAPAAGHRVELRRLRQLVPGRARPNTTIWPGSTWPYRRRLRRFRPEDYELRPRAARGRRRGRSRACARPLSAPAAAPAALTPRCENSQIAIEQHHQPERRDDAGLEQAWARASPTT